MYEAEQRTQLVARSNVTFALDLVVKHNDDPFDFADYTVDMQWRRGTTLALAASSTGANPTITVDANVVSVLVPVEVISLIPAGRFEYDVIATSPDHTWQLAIGQIDLRKGVTR